MELGKLTVESAQYSSLGICFLSRENHVGKEQGKKDKRHWKVQDESVMVIQELSGEYSLISKEYTLLHSHLVQRKHLWNQKSTAGK